MPEALSNELILETLFLHLSFEDLKACRQVSHLWKIESTKALLRNYSTSPIEFHGGSEVRLERKLYSYKNEKVELIQEFSRLISSCFGTFPSNSLCIYNTSITDAHLQLFLETQGSHIKELYSDHYRQEFDFDSNLKLQAFENLLVKQVSNLQILGISGIPKIWKPKPTIMLFENSCTEILLPNLKLLALDDVDCGCREDTDASYENSYDFIFFQKLIKGAVNLEQITSYEENGSNFPRCLHRMNKLHLIKKLDFSYCWFNKYQDTFEVTSNSNPKLTCINCSNQDFNSIVDNESEIEMQLKLTKITNRCLVSSSETLTEIDNFDQFLLLPTLQVPPLPRLQNISMHFNIVPQIDLTPIFYAGLDAEKIFPVLSSFTIKFSGTVDVGIVPIFAVSNDIIVDAEANYCKTPILSVRTLCIETTSEIVVDLFRYLNPKFPNLTCIKVPFLVRELCKPEVAEHLWTLVHLEIMELEIDVTYYGEENNSVLESAEDNWPAVEMAFTGFSAETCRRLYNSACASTSFNSSAWCCSDFESDFMEPVRPHSSLMNLKDLKQLKVTFKIDADYDERKMPWNSDCPILTRVTGVWGFQNNPKLRVSIHVQDDLPGIWYGLRDVLPSVQEIRPKPFQP